MAKVRIEHVRLTSAARRKDLDPAVVESVVSAETLDVVGAAAVLSAPAPAFPNEYGRKVTGHARLTVLSGALLAAWGAAPDVDAAGAGVMRLQPGEPVYVPLGQGHRLSLKETEANVPNSTGAPTDAAVVNPAAAGSMIGVLKGLLSTLLPVKDATGAQADAAVVNPAAAGSLVGVMKGVLFTLLAPLQVKGAPKTTQVIQIANGQSLSAAVDIGAASLVAISVPAGVVGDTLAFQTSVTGVTYLPNYDEYGVEKTVKIGASRRVILNPADFVGATFVKIEARTGAVAQAQNANRDFTLILVP